MRMIDAETSRSVEGDNVKRFLNYLHFLTKYYKLSDIFNCDETGLFFQNYAG